MSLTDKISEGKYQQLVLRDKFGHPLIDEFRVMSLGKYLRRYWLDELPQLLNIIKGDMTFIGPRPLTIDHFNSLPDDLRELRTRVKPALIPCTYADYFTIQTYEDHLESERRYLKQKLRKPISTDIIYFLKIVYNFIRGVRSL